MFSKWSNADLVTEHILYMRLWDKIQAGKCACDGVGYDYVEKILKAILDEKHKRRLP